MHNLYRTLELEQDASTQDIKRAYHRLAHQDHPDKNPGDAGAAERFRQARRAYDILSDPKRRRRYDRFGPAAVGLGGEAGASGAALAQHLAQSIGELYQQIFRRQHQDADATQPQSAALPLQIELRDAVVGGQATLSLVRHALCACCTGSGHKPGTAPTACPVCNSTGSLRRKQGIFTIGKRCPHCAGHGTLHACVCEACGGAGTHSRDAVIKVNIPQGAKNGTLLRLRGEGAPRRDGSGTLRQTDLMVRLQVRPHPRFCQEGLDLRCDWPITIVEAALGAAVQIPAIDGAPVTVRIPAGSQHGDVVRLAQAGATRLGGTQRGDLCVTLQLEVPCALPQSAQAHLQALCPLDLAAHYPRRAHAQAQGQASSSYGASASHSTAHPKPRS